MPVNLRQRIEKDLAVSLEGAFGLPVELIDPDGVTYNTSANDPAQPLVGRVTYDRSEENVETGEPMLVPLPVVTLRRSSLGRIPEDGERWAVKIPEDPDPEAPKKTFIFFGRALRGGRSMGVLKIYPQEAEQE